MKIFKKIYITLAVSAAALSMASCVNDEPGTTLPSGPSPLEIKAKIQKPRATRATIWDIQDQWSYTGFQEGDKMGFFSSGGNWSVDNGRGDFINQLLIYDGSGTQFKDPDGAQFSPTHMEGSKIYMYFPYSPDIDTDEGYNLRVDVEDTLRCRDFLSSQSLEVMGELNGSKVGLFGEFLHAFSELIIMRGEGFDDPPEGLEKITVVLSDPITAIKVEVNTTDGWAATPSLIYSTTSGLTRNEAKEWVAWRGGNYGITEEDPIGVPAWYAIVPTIGCTEGLNTRPGPRSTVEYIELYDNDGYLQRVTSLQLSGGKSKFVDAGWRYPMEIVMKELVPTVNPFRIVPWNDDVVLTDERKRGINDLTEFERWVRAYNAYILDPDNEDKRKELLPFGDLYIDEDSKSHWHFYVLNDLDLSTYTPPMGDDGVPMPDNGVIIPELRDVLDGISTNFVDGKFENHTITGLTKTFIGNLNTEYGALQNFNFISPDVKFTEDDATPAGLLVMNIDRGAVENCNVDNATLYHPGGPAGMVSGTMTGGMVKDCKLEGIIFATSTATLGNAGKIIGTDPTSDFSIINNDISGVIFNE